MDLSKIKTVYLQDTYKTQVGHQEFIRHMRLGVRPSKYQQRYIAAKKHNGVWVGVDTLINFTCKCGCNFFRFWYQNSDQRNIFVYKCDSCKETITINSYEVATPDQPLGRWIKQDGKWFVKVITGDTSKHDEIAIRSSKGLQRKKIKNVSLFSNIIS